MKGLSVWASSPPPLFAKFVQGGVHTLQWSGRQGHVYTGQLCGPELGGILSSKPCVIWLVLAEAEAEPAWGGVGPTPGQQCCSPRAGHSLPGKGPRLKAIWYIPVSSQLTLEGE